MLIKERNFCQNKFEKNYILDFLSETHYILEIISGSVKTSIKDNLTLMQHIPKLYGHKIWLPDEILNIQLKGEFQINNK